MTETDMRRISMAIDLKKYRLRFHKQTMKLLGFPPFVQLLFSSRRKAIVVLKCETQIPGGQEIPVIYDKPDPAGTFDIYSKELISRIRKEFGGLDREGLYRLTGYPIAGEEGACFPLSTLRRAEGGDVS